MSLFEVKGWDVPSGPVASGPRTSKKRKRPQADNKDLTAAETNINTLMAIVEKGTHESNPKSKKPKNDSNAKNSSNVSKKDQNKDKVITKQVADSSSPSKSKRSKKEKKKEKPAGTAQNEKGNVNKQDKKEKPKNTTEKADKQLTSLQASMKGSLDGARFRFINEVLYTTDSAEGHKLMQEDPKVFEEYHTGFRQQVLSWPSNPVNHYIDALSSYPKGTVIVDLGCGEAMLAQTLVPKGLCVLSYDLVSDGSYILEADVCQRVPLPGSEDPAEGQVVDVCVCALSLMSLDWVSCIREIWRILKTGGELKIAEVTSRIIEPERFISVIRELGFKLKSKDDSNTHFILFEFQKIDRSLLTKKKWQTLKSKHDVLKPCEYKRR
ncbi:hypothetical protein M422DRAFT_22901 [Sphaerobolus stellatus SS14]|nr:hypothetical protein M422DRAFT_22901 [Sphaerobolus stellatus SS14]